MTEFFEAGKRFLPRTWRRFGNRRSLGDAPACKLIHCDEIAAPDFDLARTLDSGQVFHWEPCGDGFAGAIGAQAVYVEQRDDGIFFSGATAKTVTRYFALDHPLAEIRRSFPRDPTMSAARDFCQVVDWLTQGWRSRWSSRWRLASAPTLPSSLWCAASCSSLWSTVTRTG